MSGKVVARTRRYGAALNRIMVLTARRSFGADRDAPLKCSFLWTHCQPPNDETLGCVERQELANGHTAQPVRMFLVNVKFSERTMMIHNSSLLRSLSGEKAKRWGQTLLRTCTGISSSKGFWEANAVTSISNFGLTLLRSRLQGEISCLFAPNCPATRIAMLGIYCRN
jgi:hypothetical protein